MSVLELAKKKLNQIEDDKESRVVIVFKSAHDVLDERAEKARAVLVRSAELQAYAEALGEPELADRMALSESGFESWEHVARALKLQPKKS